MKKSDYSALPDLAHHLQQHLAHALTSLKSNKPLKQEKKKHKKLIISLTWAGIIGTLLLSNKA